MVSQVMAVARGLSAWRDDHGVAVRALRAGDLAGFAAEFGPGVAGHAIVSMRLPAVRRFLVESGLVAGVPLSRKRQRRSLAQGPALVSVAAEAEWVAWGRWQREVRGISDGCVRYRRGWVASFVEGLVHDGVVDWGACHSGPQPPVEVRWSADRGRLRGSHLETPAAANARACVARDGGGVPVPSIALLTEPGPASKPCSSSRARSRSATTITAFSVRAGTWRGCGERGSSAAAGPSSRARWRIL